VDTGSHEENASKQKANGTISESIAFGAVIVMTTGCFRGPMS
jgi:hypothetical protein